MLAPFSACLEVLFADEAETTADRVRASAEAGFRHVEMWHWRNKDCRAIREALDETGLALVSMIVEPQLPLVDEVPAEAIEAAVRESAAAARDLGTGQLIVVAGDLRPGASRESQHAALRHNLDVAARAAEAEGVTLLLEPLNSRVDHVGHYLDRTPEALELIAAVGRPSLRLLYDVYHSVVMDEDTAEVLAGQVGLVGHVHLADAPGRQEPGSGGADLAARLTWLRRQGYEGPIGLEFWPTVPTRQTLATLSRLAEFSSI